MSSKQVSCLIRHGLYHPGDIVFKNGRRTPYTVRLPSVRTEELYDCLAESAWSLAEFARFEEVHCIGIANSGIPLAQAIHACALRLGKRSQYSTIDPRIAGPQLQNLGQGVTPILIDNAVTTGETLAKVLGMLWHLTQRPRYVIRIFDREDLGEDGLSTDERIKADLGVELVSIFRLRDLLPLLGDEHRKTILRYQARYGTSAFKEWIGGQHVL